MKEIILVLAMIIFFLIGDHFMKNIDKDIKALKKSLTLLICDEEMIKQIPSKVFEYCDCIDLQSDLTMYEDYQYFIVLTSDDYTNLMLNYHIHKRIEYCRVYAICHQMDNYNLYVNKNIEIIEIDELLALVESLYEENIS